MSSYSVGETKPSWESDDFGYKKTSMYSLIAFDNWICLIQCLRFSSSSWIDDQNDFIIALSNASPTESNEGMRPAERTFSVKTQDVNWTPWSWHYPVFSVQLI